MTPSQRNMAEAPGTASTPTTEPPNTEAPATEPPPNTEAIRVQRTPRWFTGRSELIVAGGVLVLAGVLAVGTATMQVPPDTAWPGPQFFPTIVTAFLAIAGVGLAVDVLRTSRRAHIAGDPAEVSDEMLQELGGIDATSEVRVVSPEEIVEREAAAGQSAPAQGADLTTVLIVVGILAAFILLLPILGWLIASAALFWAMAWAFGSKRPLFDIALAALIAGIVQLAFSAGLGLSLPAGLLEGVFAWIS
ncbi:tripartite tricarboxylate transporter TctB family protein [Leucobacter rhizosphaerae]|uniref:Tripartite tricarboxylate transporter TctB family protein n=1 Tax=Leucobacter rhizosphaerae TaxID=2932245 RepID=A0ABY4FS42_9MICO|nr:tripartite tricarboxylate transporter TctB family protein [Leucobacter rhizosphaerae]UOQ59120.1 tripartite tricarboxylate transporter TctB family protein [Leucobacter rhizosphaerae]